MATCAGEFNVFRYITDYHSTRAIIVLDGHASNAWTVSTLREDI